MRKYFLFFLTTLILQCGFCQNKVLEFERREDSLFKKYLVGLLDSNNYIYYNYKGNDIFMSDSSIFYISIKKDSFIILKSDSMLKMAQRCKLMNNRKTREFLKVAQKSEVYNPLGSIYYFEISKCKQIFSFYLSLSTFWGNEKKYDCFIQGLYTLAVYLYAIENT